MDLLPKGYTEIMDGKLRSSDLCWNVHSKVWEHPKPIDWEVVGSDVRYYYHVIRKNV